MAEGQRGLAAWLRPDADPNRAAAHPFIFKQHIILNESVKALMNRGFWMAS